MNVNAPATTATVIAMLLVAAFYHGDLAGHLVHSVAQRASCYFPYFEIIAEHALSAGHVDLITDQAAPMTAAAAIGTRSTSTGSPSTFRITTSGWPRQSVRRHALRRPRPCHARPPPQRTRA